jgi:hypothetical protein
MNREGAKPYSAGWHERIVWCGADQRFRRREGFRITAIGHGKLAALGTFGRAMLWGKRLAPQLGREPSRQGQFLASIRPVALDLGMWGRKRGSEELGRTSLGFLGVDPFTCW